MREYLAVQGVAVNSPSMLIFFKKKKTYLDTIQGHMCMRRVRGEKLFL